MIFDYAKCFKHDATDSLLYYFTREMFFLNEERIILTLSPKQSL